MSIPPLTATSLQWPHSSTMVTFLCSKGGGCGGSTVLYRQEYQKPVLLFSQPLVAFAFLSIQEFRRLKGTKKSSLKRGNGHPRIYPQHSKLVRHCFVQLIYKVLKELYAYVFCKIQENHKNVHFLTLQLRCNMYCFQLSD